MLAFIIRRFFSMVLVLLCVVTMTFFLVMASPGGPFTREKDLPKSVEEQLRKKFNFSGSKWEQFSTYLGIRRNPSGQFSGLLQGDLQPSTKYPDRSVNELIGQNLPVSLVIGFTAFALATTIGIWLGGLAAVRHTTWVDTTAMLGALGLISIPTFVTGPVLVL